MSDLWVILWVSFASYMTGPGVPYTGICAGLNDLNGDTFIDLRDVAIFQNGYSCTGEGPAICGFYYSPGPTK